MEKNLQCTVFEWVPQKAAVIKINNVPRACGEVWGNEMIKAHVGLWGSHMHVHDECFIIIIIIVC